MSELALKRDAVRTTAPVSPDLYRAVWRWHFFAGLLVLPFMISLAATGALYLFRAELDAIFHAELKSVTAPPNAKKLAPSTLVAQALASQPGKAIKFIDPVSAATSAEITIDTAEHGRVAAYVDPYSGRVLGTLPDRGTVMWTIRKLHSLKYFGTFARTLIEISAGWSVLLVATGIYLWWPRSQTGGVMSIRGTPRRRVFWRDLHAVIGIGVASFIVFLAITGMPWSGVWGGKINDWANGSNYGYPAGVRVDVPMSNEHLDHIAKTTWSLEHAKVPQSSSGATGRAPISLDGAVAIFDRLGLAHGYAVNLPTTASGVYTASVYPSDLARQRVVHLDQYSGKPLIDMSYADYGFAGRALEWGINVHLGQEFGRANQAILAIACLAIVLFAISAGVMWWKRRPAGSLGVPPRATDRSAERGLILILAVGGIVFPLVGLSLVVMLAVDWLYQRFIGDAAGADR